jgi:hypothetical protein
MPKHRATVALLAAACAAAAPGPAAIAANFTGPLVTPAVNTLPQGMHNIEPYLIHTNVRASYDGERHRHRLDDGLRQWALAVPITYGLTDTLNAQITLSASRTSGGGLHSDGMRAGDTTVRVQQRLKGPGDDGTGWVIGLALAQRLPTGSYQRLGNNPLNGTGNGAARSTLALGGQKLQWLDDGRALRWRGQVAWSPSPGHVRLVGASVYGTPRDFRGRARVGQAWNASLAAEYALDAHWVLVGEAVWDAASAIQVIGRADGAPLRLRTGASQAYSLAPAVEYHFNPQVGLIAGVQFTVAGRNASDYVAPQVALNMVF